MREHGAGLRLRRRTRHGDTGRCVGDRGQRIRRRRDSAVLLRAAERQPA